MDGIDPEGKRPRLGSYSGLPSHSLSHRMQQQSPPPPPEPPSHTYSTHALPPPTAYNQPPPPSPYHDLPAEHRGPPEPPPQAYVHSGYNTPARDPRQYPADPGFSRSGSFSAPPRSPNDASQLTHLRPLGIATAHEGPYYPYQYPGEHPGPPPPPGYHPHETQQLNGTAPHGLPMLGHHDPLQVPPPSGPGGNYAPSPITAGPTHLGGGPSYGGPFMGGYNPQRKKQVRATQVWCPASRLTRTGC